VKESKLGQKLSIHFRWKSGIRDLDTAFLQAFTVHREKALVHSGKNLDFTGVRMDDWDNLCCSCVSVGATTD
jgi:hypothetical protein